MPVHDHPKILEITNEHNTESDVGGSIHISVNKIDELESSRCADSNGSDISLSETEGLNLELKSSDVPFDFNSKKILLCSSSQTNFRVSCMQHREFCSNLPDVPVSLPCQKNASVFMQQEVKEVSKSSSTQSLHSFRSSASELATLSLPKLQAMFEELIQTVEDVSSELVSLLLENDALQQESDARNIAIEQLLKLTWKQTENELRPVQMSVILPSNADID